LYPFKPTCLLLGGDYNSCSSPCRYMPPGTICIQSCDTTCIK